MNMHHRTDQASSRLLTIEEAARILNVSGRTVRRQIASGSLQALRIGRSVRVSPEALEGYLTAAVRR